MIYHVIKGVWGCFPNKRADGSYWPSAHCLPLYLNAPKKVHQNVPMKKEIGTFILNKPADAGVLLRTNSPVNCKEAVHTARITEGVEEHG